MIPIIKDASSDSLNVIINVFTVYDLKIYAILGYNKIKKHNSLFRMIKNTTNVVLQKKCSDSKFAENYKS